MSSAVVPYGGRFGGFMPYRMNRGGGTLSFQPRGSTPIGANRTSFRLSAPMGGSPSMSRGGSLLSTGGLRCTMGLGAGMPSAGAGPMGVMPPSFGYPFRQPPSLVGASGSSMGPSM